MTYTITTSHLLPLTNKERGGPRSLKRVSKLWLTGPNATHNIRLFSALPPLLDRGMAIKSSSSDHSLDRVKALAGLGPS